MQKHGCRYHCFMPMFFSFTSTETLSHWLRRSNNHLSLSLYKHNTEFSLQTAKLKLSEQWVTGKMMNPLQFQFTTSPKETNMLLCVPFWLPWLPSCSVTVSKILLTPLLLSTVLLFGFPTNFNLNLIRFLVLERVQMLA